MPIKNSNRITRILTLLSVIIIMNIACGQDTSYKDKEGWLGVWDAHWGLFNKKDHNNELTLRSNGEKIEGAYPSWQKGSLINCKVAGKKLTGTWKEVSDNPKNDSGDFEFTLSDDYKSLTGKWRYKWYDPALGWNGYWNGIKLNNCRIDVRATRIQATDPFNIWHLFIVYTNNDGTEYFFRGGPDGENADNYGTVRVTSGEYLPGTVDWAPNAPSTTVMIGNNACGMDVCFDRELSRINSLSVPYKISGPNSNTVARTLLIGCNIPPNKPVTFAPGWDNNALLPAQGI